MSTALQGFVRLLLAQCAFIHSKDYLHSRNILCLSLLDVRLSSEPGVEHNSKVRVCLLEYDQPNVLQASSSLEVSLSKIICPQVCLVLITMAAAMTLVQRQIRKRTPLALMATTNMTQTDVQHGTPLTAMRASSQTSNHVPNSTMPSSVPEATELSSTLLTAPDPMTSISHAPSNTSTTLPPAPSHSIPSSDPVDPQITLTFLLLSGRRRTLTFPENTTVSRVKEIVWSSWPSESQDEQPPTPGFLRLLHLGKIWMDDTRLVGES